MHDLALARCEIVGGRRSVLVAYEVMEEVRIEPRMALLHALNALEERGGGRISNNNPSTSKSARLAAVGPGSCRSG
jgi:hypothetical protein